MLFCIDIGNTNIVLGVIDKGQVLNHWRIRTERDATADELGIIVTNLFRPAGIAFNTIKHTIISVRVIMMEPVSEAVTFSTWVRTRSGLLSIPAGIHSILMRISVTACRPLA